MKVLVTGSGGFVGAATVTRLQRQADDVIDYDLMEGFDVRDYKQFKQAVDNTRPDRILHLAAIARFAEADEDPQTAFETNVLGTRNVARIADNFHIPVVYASTGSVYMPITAEPPITEEFKVSGNSIYGCTKLFGEVYIRNMEAPWIILRYAHLYGAEKRGHGLVGGFLDRIERGLAPTLYGGTQSNDFTYIDDVAEANCLALDADFDKWHQVYNIGTGQELAASDAAAAIMHAFDYTGPVEPVAARLVDAQRFVYNTSKAERMLGFKAKYNFENGLEAMRVAREQSS